MHCILFGGFDSFVAKMPVRVGAWKRNCIESETGRDGTRIGTGGEGASSHGGGGDRTCLRSQLQVAGRRAVFYQANGDVDLQDKARGVSSMFR